LNAPNLSSLEARGVTAILVWPFSVFSNSDRMDQPLADAITDDLITNLSRFPSLRVISRMTAFSYRHRNLDPAAVGSELGVRYIVEGSVRSLGGVLRVNVELVDAANRLQVWGDRFQREESQRAAVQNEIITRLARELEVEVASARSRRPVDDEAAGEPAIAELLAKGLTAQYRGPAAANIKEAKAYFEGALKRDPSLVPALVGVAAQDVMGSINYIVDAGPSLARATKFLYRAKELDPDSAVVNYWMGMLHKSRGESPAALQSLNRAIELNPSYTPAYAQTGSVLTMMGRTNAAMDPIMYAMRLSPLDPVMGIWTLLAGRAEIENGRDAAALEWFRRSEALVPNNPNVHMRLAATYALTGDRANAVKHLGVQEAIGCGSDAAIERSTSVTELATNGLPSPASGGVWPKSSRGDAVQPGSEFPVGPNPKAA